MNDDAIEKSIIDYFSEQTGLTGVIFRQSVEIDDLPEDRSVIIVTALSSENVAANLYKYSIQIDLATPYAPMDLKTEHLQLTNALRTAAYAIDNVELGTKFTANSLDFRGQSVNSTARSVENERYIYQVSMILGIAS